MPLKNRKKIIQCKICHHQLTMGGFRQHLKIKHKSMKLGEGQYWEEPEPWSASKFGGFRSLLGVDSTHFPGMELKVLEFVFCTHRCKEEIYSVYQNYDLLNISSLAIAGK